MSFAENINISIIVLVDLFKGCWTVLTNAYSCKAKHEIYASWLPLQQINYILDIQAKWGTTNVKYEGYNPKVGFIISNNILPETINDLICEYQRHINFQSTNLTVVKRRWLELYTIAIRLFIYASYISTIVHVSYSWIVRSFDKLFTFWRKFCECDICNFASIEETKYKWAL